MYVITCDESKFLRPYGPYCEFLDMNLIGEWNTCRWGALHNATIFGSLEIVEAIIKKANLWALACGAQATQIHPLNLPHR